MPDPGYFDFTAHAHESMAGRQMPAGAVYDVIGDPDREIERDDNCTEYFGTWEGRFVLVIVSYDWEPPRVVTVIVRERGGWWN